jgi:hypothetical protein
LTFDIWYEYVGGSSWDGLTVELWSGSEWVMTEPVGGWDTNAISAHNYCNSSDLSYVDGLPGFTGQQTSWVTKTISFLNTSAPSDFKFRFIHGSDGVEQLAGAYIKNVALSLQ